MRLSIIQALYMHPKVYVIYIKLGKLLSIILGKLLSINLGKLLSMNLGNDYSRICIINLLTGELYQSIQI